ncbi:hypothetical protein ABFG93_22195 (plasmid) [Pseudalkalibacillus hwajinpoensis]|uniref:hypothetical protein n=1 Tax=Guptibacillus hwajinpoensis TaxID=208199 RepID=UPI00325BBA54
MHSESDRFKLVHEEVSNLAYEGTSLRDRIVERLFKKIQSSEVLKYRFVVPASLYLRGELLCEDITELSDFQFTQADLLDLLLKDFLHNIRQSPDHHAVFRELMARDKRPAVLRTYTGQEVLLNQGVKRMKEITCPIKRRAGLRVEVFLADLSELYEDANYSVEDILQLLYCDFIESYRTGQIRNVVKSIISKLEKGI